MEVEKKTRRQIAVDAFCGCNNPLYQRLLFKAGYEMNGQWFPSNGLTLADCIHLVKEMTEEELARY
jgi:hypothetical protein